jgi:hypothetical protein
VSKLAPAHDGSTRWSHVRHASIWQCHAGVRPEPDQLGTGNQPNK